VRMTSGLSARNVQRAAPLSRDNSRRPISPVLSKWPIQATGGPTPRTNTRAALWSWPVAALACGLWLLAPPALDGQTRGRVTEPANVNCLATLGVGVTTDRRFCDVLIGTDPAAGAIVTLPPHRGPVTLRFDLHNRHTFSEEEVKANRGYARYTATIGVLTLDDGLIARAVVQSEFRTAADLLDRVGGGAGGGVKAVAPVGLEPVVMTIPAEAEAVSFLGENLEQLRGDGGLVAYTAPGRPIAIISNVTIEYAPR